MGRWSYLNSKAATYAAISAASSAEVELILVAFTRSICKAERAQNRRQRGIYWCGDRRQDEVNQATKIAEENDGGAILYCWSTLTSRT